MTTNNPVATRPATTLDSPRITMGLTGIQIQNYDDLWKFSNLVCKSKLVPEHFRNAPEDVFIAVEWGFEVGLRPMQSLQSICIINGRAALWGDAIPGMCWASGLCEWMHIPDLADIERDWSATVEVKRVGVDQPFRSTYTREMAEAAGLWNKDNWKKNPARMILNRARAFACRDAFPDVIRGLYTREEMEDVDPTADADRPRPADLQPRSVHDERPAIDVTPGRAEPAPEPATRRSKGRVKAEPAPAPETVAPEVPAATCRDCGAAEGDPHEESCNACTACGALPGEQHDDDCAEYADLRRRNAAAERQRQEPAQTAPAAAPPATGAASGIEYVAPVPPTQGTETLTRAVTVRGRAIYTAGVSAVTLIKVLAAVDAFDRAQYGGASLDAFPIVFESDAPPTDWYHLTEEQARSLLAYLQDPQNLQS